MNLNSSLIEALHSDYISLIDARSKLHESILCDSKKNYPIYIPPVFNVDEKDQILSVLKSMLDLSKPDSEKPLVPTGLLCASEETILCAENFNISKNKFKDTIVEIRSSHNKNISSNELLRFLDVEVNTKGRRNDVLSKALSISRLESLNLKRCYANIRIMDEDLDSFSWTWATNHTRICSISMEQAVALANNLSTADGKAKEVALDKLGNLNPSKKMVRKIQLNPQMRANFTYKSIDGTKRGSCAVSGVVIVRGKELPRYFWRDKPSNTECGSSRLKQESKIEDSAFIKSLNIFLYKN